MGNGLDSRAAEPAQATQPFAAPPARKVESVPVKPEDLPKATAPAEHARPHLAPTPGATGGTEIDLDEETEMRKERKVQRPAPPAQRLRAPAAAPKLDPAESEPGTDLRPRRMQHAPRPIDETDPYAK
jgi:hypothetical protein